MSKISWLDSTRQYSKIHLTDNGKTTRCGYNFSIQFSDNYWIPYRVGKRRQGVCKGCLSGLTKAEIKKHMSSWLIPENDIGWVHNHHGAVHPDVPYIHSNKGNLRDFWKEDND